ncbi:hypothetical protein GCM10007973_28890 [Polymorphobacter multimanifer]|uniref:DUF4760 domain-containing protein n=1 Tax=Polymorphobacter multimanifer TaxID=1070431 RepID=A0A841LJC2_9SPHN|nr:hypothetical protein [Polymorphobacter multimanifer]MBB6229322.1 hypothetical protein [Polymorphobacter multimanifer]GGI90802.1 hypothetical protein GCM10007973_28890 [Polymorphobacter multimanifer]
MDLYTELKGWQGAIGAVLGFAALIAGALFNFRLNRKRDERLRNEEIVSIACALYGEIVILRQSVARMANAVGYRYIRHGFQGDQPIDKYFVEQFAIANPKLYLALASKVGMLQSHLALEVVRFYARVEEAETWLPRLQVDCERPYTYGVKYVLDPAIDAVIGVTPALRIIEKMAGIIDEAGMPDLKKALDAQELEKMQSQADRERD